MKKNRINYLKERLRVNKLNILEICYKKNGHIATSFSCIDLLVYLYYQKLIVPKKKNNLIISKGHSSEAIYSILYDLKLISKNHFVNHYSENNFILGEHINKNINGIEFSTGALGHGLPFACGKALAHKKNKNKNKVFVLTGDAEFCEGSMFESLLFAVQQKLSNLIIMLDFNKIGSLDFLDKTAPLNNFFKIIQKIGFEKFEIKNSHDFKQIHNCFKRVLKSNSNKPKFIICNTVKGHGVRIFENDPLWHVKKISKEDYQYALKTLIKVDN